MKSQGENILHEYGMLLIQSNYGYYLIFFKYQLILLLLIQKKTESTFGPTAGQLFNGHPLNVIYQLHHGELITDVKHLHSFQSKTVLLNFEKDLSGEAQTREGTFTVHLFSS